MERQYYEEMHSFGRVLNKHFFKFIDALKSGDTNLASKYFVLDKQDEWSKNLKKIKELNQLEFMAKDLENPKEKMVLGESQIVFNYYNDLKQLAVAINLARNPNGTWKIIGL